MKTGARIFSLCAGIYLATALLPVCGQLWKGVPGDIDALEKAAAGGDAEAAAEYAWHLMEGRGKQPYQPMRIYGLFRKAADGGSVLGKAGLSYCFMEGLGVECDMAQAWKLAEEAAEAGHPEGWKQMGRAFIGGYGMAKDPERCRELTEKAAEAGSVSAMFNMVGMGFTTPSVSERYRGYMELAQRYGLMSALSSATWLYGQNREDPEARKAFRQVIAVLEERAATGHPKALHALGLVRVWQGDPQARMMLWAKAGQSGVGSGLDPLCEEIIKAGDGSSGQDFSYFYTTEDSFKSLCLKAYRSGARSEVVVAYAGHALQGGVAGQAPDAEAALKVYAESLPGYLKQFHFYMAMTYAERLFAGEMGERLERLAFAHAIYASDENPGAPTALCRMFLGKRDLVRARAVHRLLPAGDPRKAHYGGLIEGKLTDEQLAESDRLIEEGFPKAEAFVEEARRTLEEEGELNPPRG